FKIVRSRATTSTDRHVTPSIHHRPARTLTSGMLATNMLVANIPAKRRNRKAACSYACLTARSELQYARLPASQPQPAPPSALNCTDRAEQDDREDSGADTRRAGREDRQAFAVSQEARNDDHTGRGSHHL